MSFLDQLSALIMGGLTKEEARVFKQTGAKILWRFLLVVFIAFAMNWLAFMGIAGFARAGDIDKKIAPLSAAVDKLAQAVQMQANAATSQTLQLLRVAMVDARVKQCHATKDETRTIYRDQINDAQERYRGLMGQYYPIPACADL